MVHVLISIDCVVGKRLMLAIAVFLAAISTALGVDKPARVFIFTDINIDAGDPDDRQSLVHLLWYADELNIEGIVPDRWDAGGFEACEMVVNEYAKDYVKYDFNKKGYPAPSSIERILAVNQDDANTRFKEAVAGGEGPLYVLVWGNMISFGEAVRQCSEYVENIRLITIGTHLMKEANIKYLPESWEKTDKPCTQYNWNGFGRNRIFNDPQFNNLWWLEINWTYEGMFGGNEPAEMLEKLSHYGSMGKHLKEVVKNEDWAQYFRVGDTPSVLYLIDPENSPDDPTRSSWAGKFVNPFPETRPNYYTDDSGNIPWDYNDPCNTWENHLAVAKHASGSLEKMRPEMYRALLEKLDAIYIP